MSIYQFAQSSSLGAAVKHFLSVPIAEQSGLLNELALARAAMAPVIKLYEDTEAKRLRAKDEKEKLQLNAQLVVISERLHNALERVATIAERAQRVQKDQLITPATLAVLAAQLELIGKELLLDSMPSVYEEFAFRVQNAMTGITLVRPHGGDDEAEVQRPKAICDAMDRTVPRPPDWEG